MLVFDFNRDIKLALTATIFDEIIFTDMTMVKISDCFHYIITSLYYVMKMAGMICKSTGFWKFANCAVEFANLPDWQIGWNIYNTCHSLFRTRNTNRIQTEYKPNTNRIQTEYKPNTNRIQTEYKPNTNRIQTEYKPNTNRIQTEYKPNTNRIQTEYKPNTNRGETEVWMMVCISRTIQLVACTILMPILCRNQPPLNTPMPDKTTDMHSTAVYLHSTGSLSLYM